MNAGTEQDRETQSKTERVRARMKSSYQCNSSMLLCVILLPLPNIDGLRKNRYHS